MAKRCGWPRIDRMVGTKHPNPLCQRPATMNRNAHSALLQRQRSIERRAQSTPALEFFNVLSSAQGLQASEAPPPAAVSARRGAVDVHAPGAAGRWLMPGGGQPLGRAARCGWIERVQRAHRRLLQGAPALAATDHQRLGTRSRPVPAPQGAGPVAVARARSQAARRHRAVHAR